MKTYLVGGAVRDTLLGLVPKDMDYVIVGATEFDVEYMISQGYKKVGADFPVFLHPVTGEEYALARTERKVGVGYSGFEAYTSPDLTIEDDLMRRDLTINAMAMDLETGEIIDPFGGRHDLAQGIIRHVSEAFAEDPLRVLRVGRFVARYGFSVDYETSVMMKKIVDAGELAHISRDRIWVEFEKLLSEKNTYFGLCALHFCGALAVIFECKLYDTYKMIRAAIGHGVSRFDDLPNAYTKFIALVFDMNLSKKTLDAWRVPVVLKKQMDMIRKLDFYLYSLMVYNVEDQLQIITDTGFANDMFKQVFPALVFLDHTDDEQEKIMSNVMTLVDVVKSVDCAAIAATSKNIPHDIKEARLAALRKFKENK